MAHGIFCCGARASLVVVRGLSCPTACGTLVSQPGIEPTSPALEGGFSTTGPPGKSLRFPPDDRLDSKGLVTVPALRPSPGLSTSVWPLGVAFPGEGTGSTGGWGRERPEPGQEDTSINLLLPSPNSTCHLCPTACLGTASRKPPWLLHNHQRLLHPAYTCGP